MLILKNITKIYHPNIIALDNISLEIHAKEFVFLIGKSGAGKSTLFKIIRREEEPNRGQIYFKNKNILELNRSRLGEIRRKIAIIHQDFKLLNNKTVFENIALPLEILGKSSKEIKEEVYKITEKLKISHKLNQITETLSGGEKQKVCLARALILKPEIILADEPTGNLDPLATYEILNLLKEIREEGITIIIATHNKEVVDFIKTRVITMSNGKIIKDENPGKFQLF
jgi:cell division transport system ATP-binding protein